MDTLERSQSKIDTPFVADYHKPEPAKDAKDDRVARFIEHIEKAPPGALSFTFSREEAENVLVPAMKKL